jgi:radical SAM protein with 4Fe4S-binding SPASM domain
LGIAFRLVELLLRQKLLNRGLEGKPNTPLVVSFAVTKACNLRCLHCHVDAREALGNELGLNESVRALEAMAALGTEALIFSGGEPLLRKEFVKTLAQYCNDLGIIPAMLSNGVLLNHQVAHELKDAGMVAVGIPIDSVDPESHDKLRNVKGSFDKAVKAIKACLEANLEVIVTTMALRDTFDEMKERIDFIANLGVNEVAVYDLVPVGRGKNVIDSAMTNEQRVTLIRRLEQTQENGDMVFSMSGGQPLFPEIVSQMHKSHGTRPKDLLLKEFWVHSSIGCHAGIMYFSLRPNGDVYPCTFLPIKVGNIREESLIDIWHNSSVLKQLRNRELLKGECGACSYKFSCGGCRGRAYSRTGDYLASDSICLKDLMLIENVYPSMIERFGFCVG